MKKYILISFILFTVLFNLFSNSNYNNFSKEYNQKNYKKALYHIEKAYYEDPDNDGYIYWYGILLYMNDKYQESITILSKLSMDYYTYPAQWYHVECYIKLGKNQSAIRLLDDIINYLGIGHEWKKHFYPKLISLLIEEDNIKILKEKETELEDYYEDKREDYNWIKYLYCKYFIEYALKLAEQNKYDEADNFYLDAIALFNKGLGGNEKYINLFVYGEFYYKLKDYQNAYERFKIIPLEKNTLMIAWYKSECLKKLNKYEEGIQVLKSVLNKHDKYWDKWIYSQLIDLAVKNNDAGTLFAVEDDFLKLFKDNSEDIIYWSKYLLCKYYYDFFLDQMASDFDDKIFDIISKIEKVYNSNLGKNKKYINLKNLNIYKGACDFWLNNKKNNNKSDKHKLLILIFNKVEGFWEDKNGVENPVNNVFNISKIASIKKENEIVIKLLFYFSKGNLIPCFDYKIIDSKITKLKYGIWTSSVNGANGKPAQIIDVISPVLDITSPHHGDVIFNNKNEYDSFVYVFPSKGIPVGGTGGLAGQNVIPFIMYTKLRAGITSGDEVYSHGLILHELFHAVEGAYYEDYNFISHVFTDEYRKYWPDWYHGEGELFYQKYIYNKVVLESGIKKMIFRYDIDNSSIKEFEKYKKYIEKYKLGDLKSASDYKNKAVEYYADDDIKKALIYFNKSYDAFPYIEYVNEMLGWIYYKENNFEKSLFHYLNCNSIKERRKYLTMTAFLYEKKGDIEKTMIYYVNAYDKYNNSDDLYNMSRISLKLKDYDNSINYHLNYLKKYKEGKYSKYVLLNLCHILGYYKPDYNKMKEIIPDYFDLINDENIKSQIAYYLAIAYGETGEKEMAIKWLEKAEIYKYSPQKNIDFYRNKYNSSSPAFQ